MNFGDVAVRQSTEVTITFDDGESVDVLDHCAAYSSRSGYVITSQHVVIGRAIEFLIHTTPPSAK
ncbi:MULTISPECIES: hypothetical protein [Vibrio]|uniref:Uncharacterized protein n=1 Tax=Vibrio bivalvicida TaxID=1276888 RepID=A0ABV4MNL8_9VIBR|nr:MULTISPECIES: hypothetical protein [Vibrio]MCG9579902.1 hypothetical protein [Vibrio tubiashii]MCG9613493.1 hypothetical protein [Vibrio tubiashii]